MSTGLYNTADSDCSNNMPMLTSEFPPSGTNTRVASSPSLPVPPYEPTQHSENPYLSNNPLSQEGSYVDGAILAPCMQYLIAHQAQHSGSVLSTGMQYSWLELENHVVCEPTGVTEDMRLNETHVGLGVSQVGSFDPTDTASPDPFLPLQLGHQSALTNEDSRMSHWIAPLGDLALATGCSSVCQSSFVPINSNTLTLPQIEPTSNTETAVTQTEMGKNISSSNSHCKTPQSYKSTTNPPSLAHYNAMADIIAYPFIPLPVCSPLDFPYQDFSSISTFSYDSLADPDPSNYSYVPNSTGDTSYPLSVDTTPSNQTDTGPLLIEDQTGDEESMSSSGNGWLCAPISLEYSDNCCMNQLKTYPLGGERKPDPYRSTVRESYLISPNDTLCNDQAGAHKCNYSSPVTGEPCGAILSRVYDCNRHEDSILLDSEKEFKYHLGGEAGLSTRCQGTVT